MKCKCIKESNGDSSNGNMATVWIKMEEEKATTEPVLLELYLTADVCDDK